MDDINKDDLFCDYYEKWIKIYKEENLSQKTVLNIIDAVLNILLLIEHAYK